jgi:hypothetical protein
VKRTNVKRLAAILHQPAYSQSLIAHCRLLLPPAQVATAPLWSPGNGYLDVLIAQVWAKPASGDTVHTTAVAVAPGVDGRILGAGEVAVSDVVGLGGLCDKPYRIGWMAQSGSLHTTPLTSDHPALAYLAWCARVTDQIDNQLDECWYRRGLLGDSICLSRLPGGGFQATVDLLVDPHPYRRHYDVAEHAAVLAMVARTLGHGTRIRFDSDHDGAELDPLYYRARRRFVGGARCRANGESP